MEKNAKIKQVKILTDLELPLVRMKTGKIEDKTPGKFRRIPSEKWKGILRTDRPPESFRDCEIAIQTGHMLADGRRWYELDIDLKHEHGRQSWEWLRQKYPQDWGGPCARTESGGLHFVFSSEWQYRVQLSLFPGIDFLGLGGLSFAPPSRFAEGASLRDPYQWLTPPGPAHSLPELPEWLAGHLRSQEAKNNAQQEHFAKSEDEQRLPLAPGPSLEWLGLLLDQHTPEGGLSYSSWLRIGMALHESSGGADEALELWDSWGARVAHERGGDYDSKVTRIKWDSFGEGSAAGRVGFGSLVRICLEDPRVVAFVRDSVPAWSQVGSLEHSGTVDRTVHKNDRGDCTGGQQIEASTEDCLLNEFAGLDVGPNQAQCAGTVDVPKNVPPQTDEDLLRELAGEPPTTRRARRRPHPDGPLLIPEVVSATVIPPPADANKILYLPQDHLFDRFRDAIGIGEHDLKRNDCTGGIEIIRKGQLRVVEDSVFCSLFLTCRDFGHVRNIVPLTVKDNLNSFLQVVSDMNRYHPIKNYMERSKDKYHEWQLLNSLSGEVFQDDYQMQLLFSQLDFGTEHEEKRWFCRAFRHWLMGAVCRVIWGYQNQTLIMESSIQGKGKSSLAEALTKGIGPTYFQRGNINPQDKDHVLRLPQSLVWEIDEMGATTRSDVDKLKSFLTRSTINERRPYDKTPSEARAVCSFIGTTNDSKYLRDATGSRRFIVTKFLNKNGPALWQWLDESFDADLLWGETYAFLCSKGLKSPPYDPEFHEMAAEKAETVREIGEVEDILLDYTEACPEGWITRKELRAFFTTHNIRSSGVIGQAASHFARLLSLDVARIEGWKKLGGKMERVFYGVRMKSENKPDSAAELAKIAKENAR